MDKFLRFLTAGVGLGRFQAQLTRKIQGTPCSPLITKSSLCCRIFALLKFTLEIDEGVHILPAQTKIVNHSTKYLIYHEWTKYSIE